MASLNADYHLDQGSTFVLEFKVYDDDMQPVPLTELVGGSGGSHALTDYRFSMKVWRTKYRSSLIYSCGTTQNFVLQPGDTHEMVQDGFYMVGGNTGFARMVIPWESNASFKAGINFYKVEMLKMVSGGEIVSKILTGKLDIDAETTRP